MASVLTLRESNRQLAERVWRSARGVTLDAIHPDGSPADPDCIARNLLGKLARSPDGVLAVLIRPPAFAVSLDEPDASQALARLGADALGVRSPDGESAFVFRGQPPRIARDGARLVGRLVLPGMALPDGGGWEAIGAGLLERLGDPRAEALPTLPDWLAAWLAGEEGSADEAAPSRAAERPQSCATCCNFDPATHECRRGPPSFVVTASGLAPGWLITRPDDVCAAFAARTAPPPACRGCRWFRDLPGHGGRRGLCRGSPPLQPLDNTGRPTGRTGSWPSVAATAWCGSHAPTAQGREEAA